MYEKMWVTYPDLIVKILDYFNVSNKSDNINKKTVLKFALNFKADDNSLTINPVYIEKICDKLCLAGILICIKHGTGINYDGVYLFISKDNDFYQKCKNGLTYYLNSTVYGFEYIYSSFKKNMLPIVYKGSDVDAQMGTCFRFADGIVTAKHCLSDLQEASIIGYDSEFLNKCNIYVSDNENVDLAYIETKEKITGMEAICDAKIMEEVLVLGYPKIPTFTDFLTAELATVSSKSIARLTPTKGSIAAYGTQYTSAIEALLITAKIRGGNSGGPVINSAGFVVGVACQTPYYGEDAGDYDDLGYGIAIPINYLVEITQKRNNKMTLKKNFFVNYEK